jgi:hypothetical protein
MEILKVAAFAGGDVLDKTSPRDGSALAVDGLMP